MSKILGYMKNTFTDKSTNRTVEYARIYAGEKITKGGAGVSVTAYKSTVQVVDSLKPDIIGADVNLFFDRYNRVQLVQINDEPVK